MTVNGCDGNSTSDVSAREDLEIVQTDSKSESGSSKGAVPVTLGVTPAHRMYRGEKDANYRSGKKIFRLTERCNRSTFDNSVLKM